MHLALSLFCRAMDRPSTIFYLLGSILISLPTAFSNKICPNGLQCNDTQDCCIIGCCPSSSSGKNNLIFTHYDRISEPMKYYLWSLICITSVVFTLAWCCKLRQHIRWRRFCISCNCSQTTRSSEPDSAGSCYYPPQYSRCGSLCRGTAQPAPPPYNEVTSKPDLYPMVIYLGPDKNDGDFMMHYFKNYLVKPTGSLSATSTTDSLNSSFLYHATNEANTTIPPPYSCTGSSEWPESAHSASPRQQRILRSISSVIYQHHQYQQSSSNSNYQQLRNSVQNDNNLNTTGASNFEPKYSITKRIVHASSVPNNTSNSDECDDNINPATKTSREHNRSFNEEFDLEDQATASGSKQGQLRVQINRYCTHSSDESLDNNFDHNSDFFKNISCSENEIDFNTNLKENCLHHKCYSTNNGYNLQSDNCAECTSNEAGKPSNYNISSSEDNHYRCCCNSTIEERIMKNVSSDYSILNKKINNFDSKDEIRFFSVGNSMTESDISSLANLGTPDSPPRATSPTSEMREILDKIQQLPMKNSFENGTDDCSQAFETKGKRYFNKNRKKNMYMPLSSTSKSFIGKISPQSGGDKIYLTKRRWLSRSAPTTPCGIVPNLLAISGKNNSGKLLTTNKQNATDSNPLLAEREFSGDEDDKE